MIKVRNHPQFGCESIEMGAGGESGSSIENPFLSGTNTVLSEFRRETTEFVIPMKNQSGGLDGVN